jgi:hypothetical protein
MTFQSLNSKLETKPEAKKSATSRARGCCKSILLLVFLFCGLISAKAQLCDPGSNCDVEDNGGPIVQGPTTVFLIFWLPDNFHYDTSVANGDANYENLMTRFFQDVSGSSYFNILTQYPGTCGSSVPTAQSCLSSITAEALPVDSSAYNQFNAADQGTAAQPLQDSDIQSEVQKIIRANQITPGLNAIFAVFTGAGVQECISAGVCTQNFFCAYHSNAATAAGNPVLYLYLPQDSSLGSGCSAGISTSPNNQIAADQEIEFMSHEFFETVSDPLADGLANSIAWISDDPSNQSAPGEIGDNCNQITGNVESNGSNVSLNGDPYVVQQIWSNDDAACVLSFASAITGPSIEYTIGTGGDDLRGDSSATSALEASGGSAFQNVNLKTQSQGDSWENGSTEVRVFQLNQPQPVQQPSDLGNVAVTLTSHDSGLETPDNWNIQTLDVKLRNPNGTIICSQSMSGNPLARLTGQAPTGIFATPSCAPSAPPTSFTSVIITIGTGNDDARSDTELWATFSGEPALCLKPSNNADADGTCPNGGSSHDQNGQQSWNNWTSSTQTFSLATPSTLAGATLTILLLEHNSGFEGDDNWDIQNITVTGKDSSGNSTVLLNMANARDSNNQNNCMARLKGSPNPSSVTYVLSASNPGGSNLSNPTFGPTPPGSCPQ